MEKKTSRTKNSSKAKTNTISKFDEIYTEQVYQLALLGLTNKEIADVFGVSERTLNTWMNAHPDFATNLRNGKKIADGKVAASLFKRATGYSHPDIHFTVYEGVVTETPFTKHYPPDTVAGIFWLKNRQRREWSDRPDQIDDNQVPQPVKVVIEVKDASLPEPAES